MNWLKERRKELTLTQEDMAAKLQLKGFTVTPGAISHWETGKHSPPLQDPEFRVAFADVLRMSVKAMLMLAGYEVMDTGHSDEAERIANLVDKLPPDKRELALKLVEQLMNYG